MDVATASAVAALVVSILAMTVAFAQALQQYLITGQLIRTCDSVVYGKMPGRGRRVWESSQFRFRVLYSVPHFVLRPSLWMDGLPHPSHEKDLPQVPDLSHSPGRPNGRFRWLLSMPPAGQEESPHSGVPGEASWVSFCRTVQYSCGQDLLYDMVAGDADRCPADLPVVPVQVSMRDVVTLALMAGMRCTDASFERRVLAMEGLAGAISSSWHPILGAVIHFNRRKSHQPQGLRVGDGSVNPDWMARMWDVVVVAGRQYTLRDRKFYEVYEDYNWVTLSSDRTLASLAPASSRPSPEAMNLRYRRNSWNSNRFGSRRSSTTSALRPDGTDNMNPDSGSADPDVLVSRMPTDGDWRFQSQESIKKDDSAQELQEKRQTEVRMAFPMSDLPWHRRWARWIRNKLTTSNRNTTDATPNSYIMDLENSGAKEGLKTSSPIPISKGPKLKVEIAQDATNVHLNAPTHTSRTPGANFTSKRQGRKALDGDTLLSYIAEKREPKSNSQITGKLLPWHTLETVPAEIEGSSGWHSSYNEQRRDRSLSIADKWRGIVELRQSRREERDHHEDWETSSYRSSRLWSVGSRERPQRQSSGASRSVSRDSQRSRGSSHGFYDREQSRGRRLERDTRTRGEQLPPSRERPRNTHRDDSPSSAIQERSLSLLPQELFEYGEMPIYGQHPPKTKKQGGNDTSDISSDSDNSESAGEPSIVLPKHGAFDDQEDDIKIERDEESERKKIEIMEPEKRMSPMPSASKPPKGILKPPREAFPEEDNVIREGVMPANHRMGIPPTARWTKIDRRLVSPEALQEANERYETRPDYVIVLRVLSRERIQVLAERTRELRGRCLIDDPVHPALPCGGFSAFSEGVTAALRHIETDWTLRQAPATRNPDGQTPTRTS